jgi:glycosyltransferase involved in cell wall biosynthesis
MSHFVKDLVSIIITNYNYESYIRQAVESALAQDYPSIQVIVVDDGSIDNSVDVIKSISGSFELICKPNGGVSSARNVGMSVAKGEYVAYLDADDYWLPNKISTQLFELKRNKTQLNYCRMLHVDVEKSTEWLSTESKTGNFHSYFLDHPASTPFPPSTVLMSQQLCSLIGDWDPNLRSAAEDYDYFRRASEYSEFSFTELPLVVHREHLTSLTSGPLIGYFRYNFLAFTKAYSENKGIYPSRINRKRRRKFLYLFAKSFLKQRQIRLAIKLLVVAIQTERNFLNLKLW